MKKCVECIKEMNCFVCRQKDAEAKLKVQFEYVVTHPTVWLTPEEMAVLAGRKVRVTIEEVEE